MRKTIQTCILITSLLFFVSLTRTQAQTSKEQHYKDFVTENPTADADIKTASDFLNALVAADFDKAKSLLAASYKGYGPGPLDSATAEEAIRSWQVNDSAQADRKIDFAPVTFRVLSGDQEGHWVTMWGDYSFSQGGKTVKFPFQYTAHVTNGKIDRDIAYYDRLYIYQALGYTLTPPKSN